MFFLVLVTDGSVFRIFKFSFFSLLVFLLWLLLLPSFLLTFSWCFLFLIFIHFSLILLFLFCFFSCVYFVFYIFVWLYFKGFTQSLSSLWVNRNIALSICSERNVFSVIIYNGIMRSYNNRFWLVNSLKLIVQSTSGTNTFIQQNEQSFTF